MFTSSERSNTSRRAQRALQSLSAVGVIAALAIVGVAYSSSAGSHVASASTIQPKAIDAYIIFSANASGIQGEGSTGGPGNIEVSSFQWGLNMSVDTATNRPAGRVTHNPFSITRQIDSASPVFFKDCAAGTIIKQVTVFMTPSLSSTSKNTMTITLYNVFVASDTWNGANSGVASSETIKLIPSSYQIKYS